MKLVRCCALTACLMAMSLCATTGHATDVKVHVTRVDAKGGDMRVQVCTPTTFLKECPYRAKTAAQAGATDVVVKDVPPGTYSIVVHHDINRNGKVDSNLFGVPREGVGFSRDPMLVMRAPTFDETSVPIAGTLAEVNIALKFEP